MTPIDFGQYKLVGTTIFTCTSGRGFNAALYHGQSRLGLVIKPASSLQLLFKLAEEAKAALLNYCAGLRTPTGDAPALTAERFVVEMINVEHAKRHLKPKLNGNYLVFDGETLSVTPKGENPDDTLAQVTAAAGTVVLNHLPIDDAAQIYSFATNCRAFQARNIQGA